MLDAHTLIAKMGTLYDRPRLQSGGCSNRKRPLTAASGTTLALAYAKACPVTLHTSFLSFYTSPLNSSITLPKNKMLRRKPTTITLTSEDIAAFEDHRNNNRQQENTDPTSAAAMRTPVKGADGSGKKDPNDELKPLPGDRARVRGATAGLGREERIMGR